MALENILNKYRENKDQIKKKVEHYELLLMGNRITLGMRVMFASALTNFGFKLAGPDLLDAPAVISTLYAGIFCGLSEIITKAGTTTPLYFKRTEQHIKEYGRLDEKFTQTLIEGTENRCMTGYCQQQGLYLAARKHKQLDTFKKVKKEYSNIKIPFF